MESVGKFRKREVPFTQISNHLLRDSNISLKAKGLYSLIASYLGIADFVLYKNTLRNNCSEGRDAFDKAWNELKKAGYLKQYKVKTDQGRFEYEYEILDKPDTSDTDSMISNNANNPGNNNNTKNDGINESSSDITAIYGFSVYGNPVNGMPVTEVPESLIDTLNRNNIKKNMLLNNNNTLSDSMKSRNSDLTATSCFYSKISTWLADLSKIMPKEVLETKSKLDLLFTKLPLDSMNIVNKFSESQARDMFNFAMDLYNPIDEQKTLKSHVFNKEGYLIGYIRKQAII